MDIETSLGLHYDGEIVFIHHIRLKYEEALFSNFGGVSRAARSMRPSGKVSAFMNQNPRKVAAFVSECLADYRRFEASDLLPYATRETLEELGLVGYQIDTFSSDYDDYIDESGMVYDAHGAQFGSVTGAPFVGPLCNL